MAASTAVSTTCPSRIDSYEEQLLGLPLRPLGIAPTGMSFYAADRASLTETVSTFRQGKGGWHQKKMLLGVALENSGNKFDGETNVLETSKKEKLRNPCDYINPENIVTWVCFQERKIDAGGAVHISAKGHSVQRLNALQLAMDKESLVTVILGPGFTQNRLQLPPCFQYVSAGEHQVGRVWDEPGEDNLVVSRMLLQRYDIDKKTWLFPFCPDPPILSERSFEKRVKEQDCVTCREPSPHIYLQSWFCTNKNCKTFGTNNGAVVPKPAEMTFHPSFLQQNFSRDGFTSPEVPNFPRDLVQALQRMTDVEIIKDDRKLRLMWSGIICPNCARCCIRKSCLGWNCDGAGCGYALGRAMPYKTLESARGNPNVDDKGFPDPQIKILNHDAGLTLMTSYTEEYRIDVVSFPDERSSAPTGPEEADKDERLWTKTTNRPGGADELFDRWQKEVLKVENGHLNLMRGLSKGGDRGYLSRHFGHDDTADDLIYDYGNENARGSVANAYMDCDFHTDGDNGQVGDVHASVSAGAPAKLKVRIDPKHYDNTACCDVHVPASKFHKRFEALKRDYIAKKITKQEYIALKKECRERNPNKKKTRPILQAILHHGTKLIFERSPLQCYYQHSVVPQGFRFGITARELIVEVCEKLQAAREAKATAKANGQLVTGSDSSDSENDAEDDDIGEYQTHRETDPGQDNLSLNADGHGSGALDDHETISNVGLKRRSDSISG